MPQIISPQIISQRWLIGGAIALVGTFLLAWDQGIAYLFDWDELIYGSIAREMVLSGDWRRVIINGELFWEKPPLFFWGQAIAMRWLGVTELAARLPSAVAGGLLMAGVVLVGRWLHGWRFGLIWAALLIGSPLPGIYSKLGLIDPTFNLLMLSGLVSLFWVDQVRGHDPNHRLRAQAGGLAIAALSFGLAVLAKGPLGLGLPLAIWGLYKSVVRHPRPAWGPSLVAGLGAVGIGLSWYLLELLLAGPTFLVEFWQYQWRLLTTDQANAGPIYFHLLAYALGCFPFAVLTPVGGWLAWQGGLPPLSGEPKTGLTRRWGRLVCIAFGFVLLLFSLVVQNKLIHYTALLYPLGAYLGTLRLQALPRLPWHWLEKLGLAVSWLVVGILLLAVPWAGQYPTQLQASLGLTDPLTLGYLGADVNWPRVTYLPVLSWLGLGLWGWFTPKKILCKQSWPKRSPWQRSLWRGFLGLGLLCLSTQLSWHLLAPRLAQHTQGGAIALYQSFAETGPLADQTVAGYGFVTFIPFFYGPRQSPQATTLADLAPQLTVAPPLDYVITWQPFVEALTTSLPLRVEETSGAFVLLAREDTQPAP